MKGNTMSRIILLADIDDNLCHTTKKFRRYVGDETTLGQPCVIDASGQALSFRSAKQRALLDWVMSGATVVPLTGRNTEKFRQVQLGFSGYAIVSFGGLILTPEGQPEPGWYEHIAAAARAEADAMQDLLARTKSEAGRIGTNLKVQMISDAGLNLFLKIQHSENNQAELDALGAALKAMAPAAWTVHLNENQLCAYPAFLGKNLATTYFLENLAGPRTLVIGSGDSFTDLCFMELCDFVLAPSQSQIFKKLLQLGQTHC